MRQFETKDSGKRQDYESGMRRDIQENKPRYDLIVPLEGVCMLDRWADLMYRGMVKYGERNWEKANSLVELVRFKASAFRHFMQWFRGLEDEDHAAAVYFNIQCSETVKERLAKEEE